MQVEKEKHVHQLDDSWIRVSHILASVPTMGTDGKWEFPMNKIDQGVLQRKAELGGTVHAAIAAHVKDEFYPLSEKEELYFQSYLKWEETVKGYTKIPEKRLFYEPMRLTGCIDMLLDDKEKMTIVDFKCTATADLKKWSLQMAFYDVLAKANNLKGSEVANLVQLDPTGGYPNVFIVKLDKKLTEMAMSLYNIYLYLTKR